MKERSYQRSQAQRLPMNWALFHELAQVLHSVHYMQSSARGIFPQSDSHLCRLCCIRQGTETEWKAKVALHEKVIFCKAPLPWS